MTAIGKMLLVSGKKSQPVDTAAKRRSRRRRKPHRVDRIWLARASIAEKEEVTTWPMQ